jgi:hypothetical protein
VKLHLDNIHVKYDDIISKARVVKHQAKRMEDYIVSEKKINDMDVKIEEKTSKVKPYQHPHYQERKEDRHQHYKEKIWNNPQYSWIRAS